MKELETGTLVWHKKYGRGIVLPAVMNQPFIHFENALGGIYIARISLFTKGDRVINTSWNGGAHDNNDYTFYDAITHNPNTKSKSTIQKKDGKIVYATSIRHFNENWMNEKNTWYHYDECGHSHSEAPNMQEILKEHKISYKHEDCNKTRMFVDRRKIKRYRLHKDERRYRSSCKHQNYSNLPKNPPLFKPDPEKIYWENNSYPQIINYEQFKVHCDQLEQEHKALFEPTGPTATEASNLLFDAIKTGSTTFDSIRNAMFKSIKRMKRVSELKNANISRSVINTILKDEGLYDAQ